MRLYELCRTFMRSVSAKTAANAEHADVPVWYADARWLLDDEVASYFSELYSRGEDLKMLNEMDSESGVRKHSSRGECRKPEIGFGCRWSRQAIRPFY
jgi:hypothetical protein